MTELKWIEKPSDWLEMKVSEWRKIEWALGSYKEVLRVPSGWVIFSGDSIGHTACFVPLAELKSTVQNND